MKLSCLAIAASLIAAPALAGSPDMPDTTPAATEGGIDHTGFYAGAQLGRGNLELSYGPYSSDRDFNGFGLHLGYLRDLGSVVLGGEFSADQLSLDDSDSDGGLLRLRLRLGADLGKFMPYATLGVARLTSDDGESGVTYGVGADFLVNERLAIGAEYTGIDFGEINDIGFEAEANLFQIRASFRF